MDEANEIEQLPWKLFLFSMVPNVQNSIDVRFKTKTCPTISVMTSWHILNKNFLYLGQMYNLAQTVTYFSGIKLKTLLFRLVHS